MNGPRNLILIIQSPIVTSLSVVRERALAKKEVGRNFCRVPGGQVSGWRAKMPKDLKVGWGFGTFYIFPYWA